LHAKSPASSRASEPDHAASANRDPDNHGFVTFLLSLTNRPRDGQLWPWYFRTRYCKN